MLQHARMIFLCACFAAAGLFISSTAMAQDDCDPGSDPSCFCFNEETGEDCTPNGDESCVCFGGEGDGGFGDEDVNFETPCDALFFCFEDCDETDLSCIRACTDNAESGEVRASFEALISCVESSGCDIEDGDCLENTCDAQAGNVEEICFGDEGNFDEPASICDDFFDCADNCEDLACAESCATRLPSEARNTFESAISCIESSGCSDASEECLFDSCGDQLNSFSQACFGSDVGFDETDGGGDGGSSNGTVTNNDGGNGNSGGGGIFSGGSPSNENTSGGNNSGSGGSGVSGLFGGGNRGGSDSNSGSSEGGSGDSGGCSVVSFGSTTGGGFAGLLILGFFGLALRRRNERS